MLKRSLFLGAVLLLGLGTFSVPVTAQASYNIKVMTPEVQQALDARRDRFEKLRAMKGKGMIGENNQGYVTALAGADSEASALVSAENQDRRVIYQTIAEQNDLKNELKTIEKVFAQVQSDKAQAGEKVQSEDGSWTTK